MGIAVSDIEIGYEYKTPNNQDRVVLGFDKSGRVVYARRGGNIENPYNDREACTKKRFAAACSKKGSEVAAPVLKKIIKALNADVLLEKSAPKKPSRKIEHSKKEKKS